MQNHPGQKIDEIDGGRKQGHRNGGVQFSNAIDEQVVGQCPERAEENASGEELNGGESAICVDGRQFGQ